MPPQGSGTVEALLAAVGCAAAERRADGASSGRTGRTAGAFSSDDGGTVRLFPPVLRRLGDRAAGSPAAGREAADVLDAPEGPAGRVVPEWAPRGLCGRAA